MESVACPRADTSELRKTIVAPPTTRAVAVVVAVALLCAAPGRAAGAPPARSAQSPSGDHTLSAHLSAGEITLGHSATVSGTLVSGAGPVAGAAVRLEASPFPYRGFVTLAHASSGPDGSFAFGGLRPDRNTRYRVVEAGPPASISPRLDLLVDVRAQLRARSHGPGEVHLSLLSYHARGLRWGRRPVWWFAAARGSRHFHLVAVTRTRDLPGGLTVAKATLNPPARHFVYRVCFNAPGERAMGPPSAHRRCPHRDFEQRR